MRLTRRSTLISAGLLAAALAAPPGPAAASSVEISEEAELALRQLYRNNPEAAELGEQAVAVLVFPDIVKAGLLIGGAYGEGAMFENGGVSGYWRSVAASFGLQAGAQKFGYALFFMDQGVRDYVDDSDGWEIGTGPSVVVLDEGWATKAGTTVSSEGIHAVFFNQSGLMAGLGLEGSKLTQFDPDD